MLEEGSKDPLSPTPPCADRGQPNSGHKATGCLASINVEEWFKGDRYETMAICRTLALARATFAIAIEEKPTGRFMICNRTRVVKRHPEGD